MSAPRWAAWRALRTTRRASSTQQSEYSIAEPVLVLEGDARRIVAKIDRARSGKDLAAAQMVVEKEAQPEEGRGTHPLAVRQHEPQRTDDVRRRLEQHFAFDERFADQPELVVLEIAQPAVDELGRGRGRAACQVALLDKAHFEAAPGRVARDSASVDAAADDDQVIHRGARPFGIRELEWNMCRILLSVFRPGRDVASRLQDFEPDAVVLADLDDGFGRPPVGDEGIDL